MTSSLAAEVSLHCIICFEEFDGKERPPVVLPCGHTYVCMVCAKRLRKCMECREPLYWTPTSSHSKGPPVLGNPAMNTRSPAPGRYSVPRGRFSSSLHPHQGGPIVPVKEEPIPLPLPKNTVLMGMMEAAERQAKLVDEARLKKSLASKGSEVKTTPEGVETELPASNFDPLIAGLNALVGTCGTYAVREPLGLAVLPFDPNKGHHHEDSDVQDCMDEKKTEEKAREPFTIEEGQTVQVVGVDEGVYQLARGAGYIVASVNQLVKVGVPLEKSCQFEGMLWSVQQKREELQRELEEIDGLLDGLRHKIQVEQEHDPEHPVITPPKEVEETPVNDENDASSGASNGPSTPTEQSSLELDPDSPLGMRSTGSTASTEVNLGMRPVTPGQHMPSLGEVYANSPAHSCPLPGTFHNHDLLQPSIDSEPAGLPRYRITDEDANGLPWSFACGSTLFGERLLDQDCAPGNMMTYSFDDTLVDSALAGRSVVNRSLAARTIAANANLTPGDGSLRSGSFDGPINFRTGMSGHTGLNVSRKKASPIDRPHIRMMSEHRGIAARPTGNTNVLQPRRPIGSMASNTAE